MPQRLTPILPKIPVEDLTIHIARSRLGLGDPVQAQLVNGKEIGIFARVWRPILGIIPRFQRRYIGKIGPVASQILAPILAEGIPLRLRVVILTPEHLAGANPAELMISVWADPKAIEPFLTLSEIKIGYPKGII